MSSNANSFLAAVLVFLAAVLLQVKFSPIFGLRPDFVLVSLVVLAFFLNFWEVAFLAVLGVFILNWQPAFSPEGLIFAVWPVGVNLLKSFLPGKLWFSSIILTGLGILVFYSFVDFGLFFGNFAVFLPSVFGGLIFGGLVFLGISRTKI